VAYTNNSIIIIIKKLLGLLQQVSTGWLPCLLPNQQHQNIYHMKKIFLVSKQLVGINCPILHRVMMCRDSEITGRYDWLNHFQTIMMADSSS